jgi:hypothetical protein
MKRTLCPGLDTVRLGFLTKNVLKVVVGVVDEIIGGINPYDRSSPKLYPHLAKNSKKTILWWS